MSESGAQEYPSAVSVIYNTTAIFDGKNIKPIVVLPGPGVPETHVQAAVSGIEEMLAYAEIENVENVMPIINLGERQDLIFGLTGKSGYEYKSNEEFCLDKWCLMRQAMNLEEWRQHAFDRIAALSLCEHCRDALKNYFRQS